MIGLAKTVRNLAVAVLLIVVAFGGYFFIYIQNREQLLIQHHLRLLSSSGSYVSDALFGLFTNVQNAATISKKEIVESSKGDTSRAGILGAITKKRALIAELADDRALRIEGDEFPQLYVRNPKVQSYRLMATDSSTWMSLAIAADTRSADAALLLAFQRDDFDTSFIWRAGLRELLAPMLPRELFHDVLLLRANGDVLLEQSASHLKFKSIDLTRRKGDKEDSTAQSGTSEVRDVVIAGQEFKLLLQPVRLPILINARPMDGKKGWVVEEHWYLAGLVHAGRLRSMSMAIAPSIVLGAIGLIAFGLLALPFLKVRFIGSREALRYADLGLLALAIVFGSAAYTFAGLFYVVQEQSAARSEDRLANLARDIASQLDRELGELDDALVALSTVKGPGTKNIAANVELVPDLLKKYDRDALGCAPFMEMAFWLNKEGTQTTKWGIRGTTTPLVDLSKREYFSQAIKGFLWPAPRREGLFAPGRYVQSIRSITTGREAAIMSRVVSDAAWAETLAVIEWRLRSVIRPVIPEGMEFAIVDQAGLVQFHSEPARNVRENLFDELGTSMGVRNAVVARRPVVTRTTYRTVPSVIQVAPIKESPWSIVVMEDARISRTRVALILGMSVAAYLLYGLILVLACCTTRWWWPHQPLPGEPRRLWYWPPNWRGEKSKDVEQQERYEGVLTVALVYLVLWGGVLLVGEPLSTLAMVMLAPFVTLFFLHGVVDMPRRPAPWHAIRNLARGLVDRASAGRLKVFGRQSNSWLFRAVMTVLVVCAGAIPAIGVFRLVHDEVQTATLQDEQSSFAKSIRERRRDRIKWYEKVAFAPENRRIVLANVLGMTEAPIGFYKPHDWEWRWTEPPKVGADTLKVCSDPYVTRAVRAVLTRFGAPGMSSEAAEAARDPWRRWACRRGSTILFSTDSSFAGILGRGGSHVADQGPTTLMISSSMRKLNLVSDLRVLVLSLLGLLALSWIVSTSIRYAFLDGLWPVKKLDDEKLGENARRAIFLRWQVPPKKRASVEVIGPTRLREAKSVTALLDEALGPEPEGKSPEQPKDITVILADFDHGLKEPEMIGKKLELLEALNGRSHAIVFIESAIEPLHFLIARHQEHFAERKTLGIAIDRWAAALECYVRVRQAGEDQVIEAVAGTDPAQVLEVECAPLDRVGLGPSIRSSLAQVKDWEPRQVVDAVLDIAKAHYRRLWSISSSEEKLLLYRIAKEGLASRHAADTLRPLQRRGLVQPPCRLMNESFRQFVLSAERADVFEKWQTRGEVSVWSKLKTPLWFALGALGVFFFATQREALSQSLGLLTVAAAVLPGVVSAMGSLARGGKSEKAGEAKA
jgi:hypothetical protein